MTKFKTFADDNLNKNNLPKCVFDRVENIVGKRENASNQHFLSLQCFQRAFNPGSLKSRLYGKELKSSVFALFFL